VLPLYFDALCPKVARELPRQLVLKRSSTLVFGQMYVER
jgi:hypothetical protein